MPINKKRSYSREQIQQAYNDAGNLSGMAKILHISYPTAQSWAKELNLKLNKVGYQKAKYTLTGLQCRSARETLGLTIKGFAKNSNVSATSLGCFERGKSEVRKKTVDKILHYFMVSGVVFHNDGTWEKISSSKNLKC